jgi:hypothetical protein
MASDEEVNLEKLKQAQVVLHMFQAQMRGEASLCGTNDTIHITPAAALEVCGAIDTVITTLNALIRYSSDVLSKPMRYVFPSRNVSENEVTDFLDSIGALRRSGPTELAKVLPGAVDRVDFGLPTMKGAMPGEPIWDEAAEFEKTGKLRPVNESNEDLKHRLHNPTRGVTWVIAGRYPQFTAWCHDRDIDHRDRSLARPLNSAQELRGLRGFHYALAAGYDQREDAAELDAMITALGGVDVNLPPTR